MSDLATRPENPAVGVAVPHESAVLHVTGKALYTDDLIYRTKDVLHAYPVQTSYAHARIVSINAAPAMAVPGVVRVLTAADVPEGGVNDAGVKHDEPLFPTEEIMFFGHAVCWVLAETLEAARLGAAAVVVEAEPLPSYIEVTEAIAAHSFQGAQPRMVRGDVDAALSEATHVFSGEFEFGGQEQFYLETHCSLALVDEGGQIFVQSSLRDHGAVPAHRRRVRRQGDASARPRRHRLPRRGPHRPPRAATAESHPGSDDVRTPARLSHRLAGRL